MNTILLFIGGPEIFIIILIIVMLFGADKIPEIARGLGKGIRQVKDATNSIKKEINESIKTEDTETTILKDTQEEFKKIQKEINTINDDINDVTGPIKRNK